MAIRGGIAPVLAAAAATAAAGCGDAPGDPAAGSGLPPATAALVERAKGCGVGRGIEVVNQGLALAVLPRRAYIAALQERSFGFEATGVVGLPIRQAFDETRRRAPAAGQRIDRTDFEGFEGEVFLDDDERRTTVFLRTTGCPDVTQVVVRAVQR